MTIVEVVVAACLITIGLGGLFQMSVRSLRMLRTQTQTAQASQALQERADYLRDLPWGYLTSSVNYTNYTYQMKDAETGTTTTENWVGLLNTFTDSAKTLSSPKETVKIIAHPVTGSSSPAIIVTNASGTITVEPAGGSDHSDEKMVRVDIRLEWKEPLTGRTRVQEAAFIVSKSGVGK